MLNGCLDLSLSNGVFSKYTLDKNIAAVKRLGFENLEFNMKSVEVENDVSVHAARHLVEAYGLECLTLHAATLHVKDEVEVHRAVYYGKISLEFARILQVPVMVVHSYVAKRLSKTLRCRVLTRVFSEIAAYAKQFNVKLALENLSYDSTGYGKSVAEIEEILNIVDDGTMGVTLDFGHAEATGQTAGLLEKYKDKLCNVHLSNRAHKAFRTETLKLKAFLKKLAKYGYSGPLTLELSQKCTAEEILETKTIFEKILSTKLFAEGGT